MAEPARKRAIYEDLYDIPENMTGEIIDGELIVSPRPAVEHGYSAFFLGGKLTPFYLGKGGRPGGWIIIGEPEVAFGEDILVPDLAGWKRERFAKSGYNWIAVTPDWVCEVLSPGTFRKDKIKKSPVYAKHGVKHFWIIDPLARSLEVFRLESGKWLLIGVYAENDLVRAEPFAEIEIELGSLWLELPEEKQGRE